MEMRSEKWKPTTTRREQLYPLTPIQRIVVASSNKITSKEWYSLPVQERRKEGKKERFNGLHSLSTNSTAFQLLTLVLSLSHIHIINSLSLTEIICWSTIYKKNIRSIKNLSRQFCCCHHSLTSDTREWEYSKGNIQLGEMGYLYLLIIKYRMELTFTNYE